MLGIGIGNTFTLATFTEGVIHETRNIVQLCNCAIAELPLRFCKVHLSTAKHMQ